MYGRSELRGRETEDSATKRNYNIHERERDRRKESERWEKSERKTDRDRDTERELWPSESLLSAITKSEHMYG